MKKAVYVFALLFLATAARAENGLPPTAAKPEEVGLSSAQLKRLEAATKQNIDDGLMPGAVMLAQAAIIE
jgi:hypothetical protein